FRPYLRGALPVSGDRVACDLAHHGAAVGGVGGAVVHLARGADLGRDVLGRDLRVVRVARVGQVVVARVRAREGEPGGGRRARAHVLGAEVGGVDAVAGDRVACDLAHHVAAVGGVGGAVVHLARGADLGRDVLGRDLRVVRVARVGQVVVARVGAREGEPGGGRRARAHALGLEAGAEV